MKKETSAFLYIFVLSVIFFIISALVVLFRGNQKLIRKKLKIGAILLSLTTSSAMISCTPTCYDPADINSMIKLLIPALIILLMSKLQSI